MGAMDPNLRVALLKGLIPGEVLRQLDAEELHDRLVKALELLAKSDAADSPAVRKALGGMAVDLLGAQPRAVTERQVAQQLYKAARAADPREAAVARDRATRIQSSNPVAPRQQDVQKPAEASPTTHLGPDSVWTEVFDKDGRRLGRTPAASIRKAKGDPMLVAFDADGQIIGIVDPANVQPVGNKSTAAPKPAARQPAAQPQAGQEVTKTLAGRAGTSRPRR